MRRPFLSALSVLSLVAAGACDGTLTEPAESVTQPPAFSVYEGPPTTSGVVQRILLGDGGAPPPATYDPDTNLSSMIGFNVDAFCQAGGPGVADPADYFEGEGLLSMVNAPGQGGLFTIRGESWLYIWNGPYVFEDTCTQLIGGGWVKNIYTENSGGGPNIADTFHFSARGPVTTADGIKQALGKVSGRVKNGVLEQLEFTVRVSN
jgi:hypothetical protein